MVQTSGEGEERWEFTAPLAAQTRLICQERTGSTATYTGGRQEGAGVWRDQEGNGQDPAGD